jgi:hypothetical protein
VQDSYLNDQDEDQRTQASFGMPTTDDPTTANLRRYEQSCRRALHWARAELQRLQADPAEAHEPAPDPVPTPQARPQPEPVPPLGDFNPLRELIAARMRARGLLEFVRQPQGNVPAGNHYDLDFPIVPTRSDNGSAAPARPPGAGDRT